MNTEPPTSGPPMSGLPPTAAETAVKLAIMVNGQPVEVQAVQRNALHSVLPPALEQTGNLGLPPENWELRDPAGTLLDTTKAVSAFGFGEGARLYLNLRPGVGG